MRLCSIPGCGEKHVAKGYCSYHYTRNFRYGTPNPPLRPYNFLKSSDIISIRKRREQGEKLSSIAATYGCHHTTIYKHVADIVTERSIKLKRKLAMRTK